MELKLIAVDMDRARLLIKFSNVAYCPEFQVTQWDCVYCREAGLKNFQPAQFLYGQFDTQGCFLFSFFFV